MCSRPAASKESRIMARNARVRQNVNRRSKMYHDILTNKWFLAGIGFLVVFTGVCYLYYQHETTPLRQQATEPNEIIQQTAETANRTEQAADAPVGSITQSAEKTINETTGAETSTDKTTKPVTASTQQTDNTEEVRVSPHGFGHYPEVCQSMRDIGYNPIWENPNWKTYSHAMEGELLSRVHIKAWEEGKESIGATIDYKTGLVLLNFPDTIYVWHGENINPKTGETQRYFTQVAGMSLSIDEMMNGTVPEGVTVLDGETSGIDPYEYLDLSR